MAMTINDYNERIEKLKERLAKIDKKIKKWEDNKLDEGFMKNYKYSQDSNGQWFLGWEHDTRILGSYEEFKVKYIDEWLKKCDREIRCAKEDKEAGELTIIKYQNAIKIVEEKNSKPVIQIFKDFFNRWKKQIIDFVTPLVTKYYDANKEACRLHNNKWQLLREGMKEEEWKAKYIEARDLEDNIKRINWVSIAIDKGFKYKTSDFEKYLDDYMNDRYFELVNKVTKFTGNITDVSALSIGYDGSLNGIILGDLGKAKLETIIAGGYNIQCKHYRVLVNRLN